MISNNASNQSLPCSRSPVKIVIFDGNCNLCSFLVGLIRTHRSHPSFELVSQLSHRGRQLLQTCRLDPDDFSSVVFLRDGVVYTKSDAVIEIGRELGGIWRCLSWIRWLPKTLRDAAYSGIAVRRYKLFGCRDSCPIDPGKTDRSDPEPTAVDQGKKD